MAKIALLGGDERQIYTARMLARRGRSVHVWGLGREEKRLCPASACENPHEALADARVLILPLPCTVDGVRVNCPLERDASFRFASLFEEWKGDLVLGGRIPESLRELAHGAEVIDYYENEALQLRNAVPTAEGAISLAMQALSVMLDGSCGAVIGYGRIATVLADKLTALGMQVYLYARKPQDLTRAGIRHLIPMSLCDRRGDSTLSRLPRNCRVIFNTVPYPLFDRAALEALPRDCVYIELASAPGGMDLIAAGELGIKRIMGGGLPGRCTPESAGEILGDVIDEILDTRGVD